MGFFNLSFFAWYPDSVSYSGGKIPLPVLNLMVTNGETDG